MCLLFSKKLWLSSETQVLPFNEVFCIKFYPHWQFDKPLQSNTKHQILQKVQNMLSYIKTNIYIFVATFFSIYLFRKENILRSQIVQSFRL